jgi:hypothetical protein
MKESTLNILGSLLAALGLLYGLYADNTNIILFNGILLLSFELRSISDLLIMSIKSQIYFGDKNAREEANKANLNASKTITKNSE